MTTATISGNSRTDVVPIGGIVSWSHEVPPAGWMLCDGSLVFRDSYPELYGVLTSSETMFPYGANVTGPTGELFFRLPDMRNRLVRTPSSGANVGSLGGNSTNTHNHDFTSAVSVNSNLGQGGHNHGQANTGTDAPGLNAMTLNFGIVISPANQLGMGTGTASDTAFSQHGHGAPASHGYGGHEGHGHSVNGFNTSSDGAHNHDVNVSNGTVSPAPVDHHPPYLEVNFIIFAGPNRFYDFWVLGHSSFPASVAT